MQPRTFYYKAKESADAEKVDLYREYKVEYAARANPAQVQVSPACYLSISGKRAPGEAINLGILLTDHGLRRGS